MKKLNREFLDTNGRHIFSALIVIIVFCGIFFTVKSSRVKTDQDGIKISGAYGINLKYEDIKEIELKQSLPNHLNKKNGVDLFGMLYLGNFKAESMDNIKVYVPSKNAPFIYIKDKDDKYIIINLKESKSTEDLYNEINLKIKK